MITTRHVNERLAEEKEPIKYIDGEVDRCLDQMSSQFEDIQKTISAFHHRDDKSEPFDLQYIKEDLREAMELYTEINVYLKVRKEQVKRQKRTVNLNKAQLKHQERIEQLNEETGKNTDNS